MKLLLLILSAAIATQAVQVKRVPEEAQSSGCRRRPENERHWRDHASWSHSGNWPRSEDWSRSGDWSHYHECSETATSIPTPSGPTVCPAIFYPCPGRCPDNCVRPTNSPCPFATRPTCPSEVCNERPCPLATIKPCPGECVNGCTYINSQDPCCDYIGEPICN